MRLLPALTLTAALAAALAACQPDAAPVADGNTDATPPTSATSATTPTFVAEPWALPSPPGAAQPDLVATADGLLLSWINPDADGHALRFSRFADGQWSAAQTIARGDDWFVNWADTPHLAATADGALWAHWLQQSAEAPYAYDVVLVRSDDHGASWSEPLRVNDDGTPTEHGFVSLWPASVDSLGIAWLDGRETAAAKGHGGHDAHAGHGGGRMTLRAARFDAKLARSGESMLDAATCDCCQTDVTMTARGPLVVYRDRTDAELRDIVVTRFDGNRWGDPTPVHADHWTMPACPVNGPAADARDDTVLVGWYTAANDMPTLKIARSLDAGDHFATPVEVDVGAAVQGRVDVAIGTDAAWVLWTREDEAGQTLQLARYAPDLSRQLQRIELARLQGRGRGTGFPQLALADGTVRVAWTDVVDGEPRLQGVVLRDPENIE
ncbi:exo-alpha-sialidase [Lysobacter sp. F60174L2]|uniref:exo-alpha-sialidase n=1 Tax=Lysobacter sp. F60174L2 TaxID=3459295 RepID=UPI00403D7498